MIALDTPLALLLLAPLLYLWWRLGRGPRRARPLRVLILVLVALCLASPVIRTHGTGRQVVFVVDRSLSAGAECVQTAAEMLGGALDEKRPEDRVRVVLVGDGAAPLFGEGNLPADLRAATLEDASDLHAGLALAASLCAAAPGGRAFLISDGLYTGPDPAELVPELRKKGVAVEYWPIEKDHQNDVAVTRVELPERARVNDPFEVAFAVHAPRPCDATVSAAGPGARFQQKVALKPGENRFAFKHALARPGLATYVVRVEQPGDPRPENNRAVAVTEGLGPAEVLVLNSAGAADNLSRALAASGLAVRLAGPQRPITSAALKPFRAVVVENVALTHLNDRADAALRNYVTEMGGGLLITGGENSFANGGYYRSRLEPVLPVSMERKDEFKRPRVAVAIVLDRSGSMSMPVPGGHSKMDLANRGAAEAVALLSDNDEVAVYAVDSVAHQVVKLTTLGGRRGAVQQDIRSIESMGGGIYVHTGLRAAVAALLKSSAPTRHIVLFSDAADSEEQTGCAKLVDKWSKANGTLSVIGLGTDKDCDAAFLKDIARRGGGQAMFTADPNALPRIFCQDAMRIARKTFIKEKTPARLLAAGLRRVGRLGIQRFPAVLGYNLCYPRPEATQVVVTADENDAPVLALWQRGLGRVAALTCETDGPYTGDLRTWPHYQPFFASLVKWLQKDRDDPALFGSILRQGRTARVRLELDAGAAARCTGAVAHIIPPDESERIELPLQWVSPDALEATFRLRQRGVYHGMIVARQESRDKAPPLRTVSLPPVVLPYSPEFELRRGPAGLEVLKALAAATGGRRILHVKDLFRGEVEHAGRRAGRSLAPALALVALVLLLADIVTRRALWAHLIPAVVRRGAAQTANSVGSLPAHLRRRIRRLRKQRPHTGAPAEPPPGSASAEPSPDETKSVFDRAKRRSRL